MRAIHLIFMLSSLGCVLGVHVLPKSHVSPQSWARRVSVSQCLFYWRTVTATSITAGLHVTCDGLTSKSPGYSYHNFCLQCSQTLFFNAKQRERNSEAIVKYKRVGAWRQAYPPPPTPLRFQFCACVQFSRVCFPALNDHGKIRENI